MDFQTHNRFLLQQKLTLLINRYEYFLYGGSKGERVAFVEQKRFAFRESFSVWTDESAREALFHIKAEKILDFHGRFAITDGQGTLIGYCRKAFGASLLRSSWDVYDAQDALLFQAKEKSKAMAIARRVAQFVPYLADVAPFFPFNFIFEKDGAVVGHYTRLWGRLTDQYELTLDLPIDYDRRILLALGILLDALQDR